jgi:Fe-S cluster assembly protein SufD
MSALAQQWGESLRSASQAEGPRWLDELRLCASDQLAAHGLPHRKDEDWKYTPMRVLEKLNPAIASYSNASRSNASRSNASRSNGVAADGAFDLASDIEFPGALHDKPDYEIKVYDGVLMGREDSERPGVTILSFAEGLKRYETLLRKHIESVDINGSAQAFAALNTATLNQGLVIHIDQQVDAGTILLRWALSGKAGPSIHNFRVFLLLDEGARMQLIEQFESADHTGSALNVLSHVDLGKNAALDHLCLQNESENTVLMSSTRIEQAQGSRYNFAGFDLGGGLVRHELKTVFAGSGAHAAFLGAFVLDKARHVDNHISVDHASPGCSSEQFFRGVLGGRSRGVFNGKALIRPGADQSSVRQSSANLLLSPLAQIDTKPELEIYADEVEASHGATVGQLDEDAIFYLRTRGLSDVEARHLLVGAFCRAVTDKLENQALALCRTGWQPPGCGKGPRGLPHPDPSGAWQAPGVFRYRCIRPTAARRDRGGRTLLPSA